MLKFHNSHNGLGTILVTTVAEPSQFGVVVSDTSGKVERFVGKSQNVVYLHR